MSAVADAATNAGRDARATGEAALRPALRWHGAKWRLAPWIIAHFPRHRVYVEPYGGGASVLMRKTPVAAELYNDLDGGAVNVFRILRDPLSAAELARRLALTPFAREEFDRTYEPAVDDIDRAAKMIALTFMGYGTDSATRSCRTGFRAVVSQNTSPAASWAGYAAAIPSFTRRLMGVCLENRPALEIIDRYAGDDAALIYVDPPYPHALRSSLKGRPGSTHGYRFEMSDADHDALLTMLRSVAGAVVLSGYASPAYDAALADWRRVSCAAMADGGRARTEVLWLNPRAARGLAQGEMFEGSAA